MNARGQAQANSELFRRFLLALGSEELSLRFSRNLINADAVTGSL
jgi:O-acetylhomoserine/O-acetylserine sulfhydrylase-like pyridoxal-dependent enzyme